MMVIRKTTDGFVVIVKDREDEVILMKAVGSETEGLDYLSHLTSVLIEGYRSAGIVREGF